MEWYFADDFTFWITGSTWSLVESKINSLLQEFELWCTDNDQQMNVGKTQVLFVRRQHLSPIKYNFQVVPVLKSLGIWIDQSFCFNAHVKKIGNWINRRIGILKSLRIRLNLSPRVLVNIAKSWRSKLIFGTYWILQLSSYQLSKLSANWPRLIKAALGLFRPVPFSTTLEIVSLDSIEVYLVYWFSVRWFESKKFSKPSILTNAESDRSAILDNKQRTRQLRASTHMNSLTSILNRSTYTQNIFNWLDKCKHWVEFLAQRNETINYKERAGKGYKNTNRKKITETVICSHIFENWKNYRFVESP